MLGLKRIDNMDILSHNVDALAEFYHQTLGLPYFLPYLPGQGWAALDAGNLTIYIFESKQGKHAARRSEVNEENPPGLDSFAFEIDDLDQAVAELDGKVELVTAEEVTWTHDSGTWYRYRPFYDPDGNMLYITEPHLVHSRLT